MVDHPSLEAFEGIRNVPAALRPTIFAALKQGQKQGVFGEIDLRNAESVVVATSRGSLNGFITGYVVNDEELFVQLVYVAPDHRRKGLGRRLYDELRRQFPDATGPVNSMVLTGNEPSEAFHRAIGMNAVATMFVSEARHA